MLTLNHFTVSEFLKGVFGTIIFVTIIFAITDYVEARIYQSQAGDYEKSKWAQRQRNKKSADKRAQSVAYHKNVKPSNQKAEKQQTTRNKKQLVLDSQASKEDFINLSIDVGDYFLDHFGHLWLRARELYEQYTCEDSFFVEAWSTIKNFDYMYYVTLFRRSDLFTNVSEILNILVALGWIKRIEIAIRGVSLYTTQQMRNRPTIWDLAGKCSDLFQKLQSRFWKAIDECSFEPFFLGEATSAYDSEFAFLKSQKVLIDLGRGNEVTDVTFDRRVAELIVTTERFINECARSERSFYSSRLVTLREIQSARTLDQKESIREKPYGILLYGASGVGKSAMVNSLTSYVLKANGKDCDPKSIITLNQQDKFQSEFRTHHKGVILDDLMNTDLKYESDSPATPIIMFLNNVPMSALNPNAEMKGMVMMEPDVVVGTTNVKDLKSNELSNEPLSINRRFEVTITQKVKPEYCKPGTEMLDATKIQHMSAESFPDYALFTVEEPRYKEISDSNQNRVNKLKSIVFDAMEFEGKKLIDVDIYTLLRFLKAHSGQFYARQKEFVSNQRSNKKMELCEHMNPIGHCAECEQLESQMSIPYYTEIVEYLTALEDDWVQWASDCKRATLESDEGQVIVAYLMKRALYAALLELFKPYGSAIVCFILCGFLADARLFLLSFPVLYHFCLEGKKVYDEIREQVIEEQCQVTRPSERFMNISWATKKRIITALSVIGLWKLFGLLVSKWKEFPKNQAAPYVKLEPDAKPYQKETEFWDTRSTEEKYQFGDAGLTHTARTVSPTQIDNIVGKKLLMVIKEDGTACDALPLKSNVFLLPNHFVNKKTEFVRAVRVGGHTFKNIPLSADICERIPGTDLAIWYSPSMGPQKDITALYPLDINEEKKLEVYTLYNNQGKMAKYAKMMAVRQKITTTDGGRFSGYKYTFPEETFGGLCMATLIGNAKGIPFIAGHHLAGRAHQGAAGFVTRTQILEAITRLEERPAVFTSHSSTPMNTSAYGVSYGPLTAPNPMCPTNDLSIDSKIKVYGAHTMPGANNTKSKVVTSVISASAARIMGIPKMHDKPEDIGHKKHKVLDMSRKVQTATKFDTELVEKAFVDYTKALEAIPRSELNKLGKIDLDANLAGLDGVVGINAMNFKTSLGFPLKGPKSQLIHKSDRKVEGIDCPRDQDPIITAEVERLEKELLEGKSINTIFKAALKDEPTKIGKGKARVFAAANVAFVELTRKYFLTMAALFQRNKITTECAVGTVVQSPEWTELYKHIGKHGWDRAIAGDYQAFDGKMSPEFILLSFKAMIQLAERSGKYDSDDLMIMKGIATEIAYPTYDYFGTILQFYGSNPSGHPLTVVVNSVVNSLYMRYTYYAIARDKRWWRVPQFNNVVSMMTYGDDNIMTVKKGYDDFNHTAIAAEYDKVGIVYTMAEKEAKSVPFINLKDASFLKHFAVWDEELKLYRSPVEETSIAKMLHAHLESDVLSMEQSSAEAISNVALKYFECGRDVYTKKVAQLEQVAQESGIKFYMEPIPTYDERLAWYRKKFDLKQ